MDVEEFVAEHYRPVLSALRVAIGNASLAEDVTQEAFVEAWRRWPSVAVMDRPVAWIYVVAMNRAKRHLRRNGHVASDGAASTVAPDPADQIALSAYLASGLSRLTARQRAAVVLRYLADLTVPEVAKALGCADGTVKATLHTALEHLRVELAEGQRP